MSSIHQHPNNPHTIHRHGHPGYLYPVHLHQRLYGLFAVPLLVIVLAVIIVHPSNVGDVSISELIKALFFSMIRMIVAFVPALLLALPLALLINKSALTERILLPAFDILQSVPILAFFPVVIIFFVHAHFLEGAAVFIIFINMLWNIVFSLVGGLRLIPSDIKAASFVFGIRNLKYAWKVLVPATIPYMVTGSLLAWAIGWNMLIVAEVMHTYLPGSSDSIDLFGIGSVMVHASASGQNNLFIASIIVIIGAIALMNFFVWQKLLRLSERYRFE